jgi:exodeoxyribonuclease V gamma subunit
LTPRESSFVSIPACTCDRAHYSVHLEGGESLKLVASNRVELLAQELRDFLATSVQNPLESEVVIVQSKGMATWLKQTLASQQGICANIDFIYPRDFISRIFKEFLQEPSPDWRVWRDDRLLWRVMTALPELLPHPAFRRVQKYLGEDLESQESQERFYQLASRVAILFDRYQNYRPEMVEEWTQSGGESWSGILFHHLVKNTDAPHLPALARSWISRGTGAHLPRHFPNRVALFGLATMPPLYLALFENLARHRGVDMRLFHLNPSRQYWADIRSKKEILRHLDRNKRPEDTDNYYEEGHPLLATLGQVGRDFQGMLIEHVESVSAADFVPHEEPYPQTILGRIQEDIDHLRQPRAGEERLPFDPADNSLRLRACDSALRQVEVLRDDLLERLNQDESLSPREVVVMCPDLDSFAPLIEAVFDRPVGSSTRGLPYRIADRQTPTENAVARAFMAILDVMGGRFEASQVLDLLGHEPIRRAFQLQEEELEKIMIWVRESGVRWGIDGEHRTRFGLPPLEENTWRFGLKRLLLGTAMSEDLEQCFGTVLPYGAAYGLESSAVGRLMEFCEALFTADQALRHARTMGTWFKDLTDLLERMCSVRDQEAWQPLVLVSSLGDLAEHAQEAAFEGQVPLCVVRQALESRLNAEPSARGFLAGGITFCRMLPMRSIPFKVVALLGMDEGVFPRRGDRLDFDLMRAHPQRGDRSPRLDDRQIFLEALLSARQAMTITFTGRHSRDQSRLSPSVVISELLDSVAETFEFKEAPGDTPAERAFNALATQHPLQPFSPRNFSDAAALRGHEQMYAQGAQALQEEQSPAPLFFTQPLPASTREQVSPQELATFYKNPVQNLLRERLALNLRQSFERPRDRESIVLGPLEQYVIRDKLLRALAENKPPKSIRTNMHAAGMLAPGHLGNNLFAKIATEVEPMALAVRSRTPPQGLQTLRIDLDIGGIRLRGAIPNVGLEGVVYGHAGTTAAKHRLETWVHHLLVTLIRGHQQVSWIFGKSKGKKTKGERLGHVSDPQALLEDLVALYKQGLCEPLCFMPATSETYYLGSDDPESAMDAARKRWGGNSFMPGLSEGQDPSAALVFGPDFPFAQPDTLGAFPSDPSLRFESLATRVFSPLHGVLKEVEL